MKILISEKQADRIFNEKIECKKCEHSWKKENDDKHIYIETTDFEGDLNIKISDNGIGIDNNTLPKIFKPFYTTGEKGTGLGLPVVKEIVDSHKGKIKIRSGHDQHFKDDFTEFIITLYEEDWLKERGVQE